MRKVLLSFIVTGLMMLAVSRVFPIARCLAASKVTSKDFPNYAVGTWGPKEAFAGRRPMRI